MMSNGYKPTPLDLSDIKLTPGQELLVDKLAENAHNVWAKDRIKQGWTYGIQQVQLGPMLLPVLPSICKERLLRQKNKCSSSVVRDILDIPAALN